ncbi:MAG: hypothetical protein KJZ87_27715 [Thermoguttaceae bacterium]|nr:hypothetical protein [Thermoguttaceae bacterium]
MNVRLVIATLLTGSMFWMTGCADQPAPAPPAGNPHSATHADAAGTAIQTALAELDPADRALAEKQATCPVSGEPLGSMGKPYKVVVEGQEVFLCCQGCEETIKSSPDEYLAKLSTADAGSP